MKCRNKEVMVLGIEYNDVSQKVKPKCFRVLVSNDDDGKTVSIDNGIIQFTIPFWQIEKYLK
jgi:hypothetical protein